MRIELQLPVRLKGNLRLRDYNPELDDVRSILVDVCDLAQDQGRFHISGFGQDPWPADVRTDLPILLEQLPEALQAVEQTQPFEIDFYEQGIERKIGFSPQQKSYTMSCSSYGTWQPSNNTEQIDREFLHSMLVAVRTEFKRFMFAHWPQLERHPWVQAWLDGNQDLA